MAISVDLTTQAASRRAIWKKYFQMERRIIIANTGRNR
jgi:hypothetical protein